jgi:hypothetical protein
MSRHGITVVRIEKNKLELGEEQQTMPAGAYREAMTLRHRVRCCACVQGLQLAPCRTRPGRAQAFLALFVLLILLGPDISPRPSPGTPTLELDNLSRTRTRRTWVTDRYPVHTRALTLIPTLRAHCVTWLRSSSGRRTLHHVGRRRQSRPNSPSHRSSISRRLTSTRSRIA